MNLRTRRVERLLTIYCVMIGLLREGELMLIENNIKG